VLQGDGEEDDILSQTTVEGVGRRSLPVQPTPSKTDGTREGASVHDPRGGGGGGGGGGHSVGLSLSMIDPREARCMRGSTF
jgi:hypothetical protein